MKRAGLLPRGPIIRSGAALTAFPLSTSGTTARW